MKRLLACLLTFITALTLLFGVYSAHALDTDYEGSDNNKDGVLSLGERGLNVFRLQIRLRELGYLSYVATGGYFSMTEKAVMRFQENNSIQTDGYTGEQTFLSIFSKDAIRANLPTGVKLSGPSLSVSPVSGAVTNWQTASEKLPVGSSFNVRDHNTGTIIRFKRTGGTNHAYVQPSSAEQRALLPSMFAEESWEVRAVLVEISGTFYAASLSGNPKGSNASANGHFELFFSGSVSDVYDLPNADHNAMIAKASGKTED